MAAMDLAAPTTIAGRYELRARLGRGGTGEVWRGHDLLLDRPVAIKRVLLPPDLAAGDRAELRARVLREARAAARIDHRGSVQVYDVLEHDEIATIVMELVDGPDLGKVIASRGPLPPHEVARIGLELLTVLERAHAAGVLHRDVKPANVLLAGSGQPKLTDFGTAVLAGDDRLTASNTVLGSPAYMSPEQALGRPLGPETDLWSLGATLYHALEGVPPFAAGTAIATARQVVDGAIRPMVSSGPVSEAVRLLLVKDPAVRATPRQVRRLLTEGAGSVIVLDPEESAAGRGRRSPVLAGGGGDVRRCWRPRWPARSSRWSSACCTRCAPRRPTPWSSRRRHRRRRTPPPPPQSQSRRRPDDGPHRGRPDDGPHRGRPDDGPHRGRPTTPHGPHQRSCRHRHRRPLRPHRRPQPPPRRPPRRQRRRRAPPGRQAPRSRRTRRS